MSPADAVLPELQPGLLPHEPRIVDAPRQQFLTERFLLPELASLEALFLHLRTGVDAALSAAMPVKLGKPYPQGQCLEITIAVRDALRDVVPAALPPAAATGHAAIGAFLQHGGNGRQVWGVLRGRYFQNAFLFGTLYVDVANDTVVPTKPKVEILPFRQAQLTPVRDHSHFALMASQYWQALVFPNHVVPALAPYAPIVVLIPGGSVRLEADSRYMLALAHARGFSSSAQMLARAPMPDNLFRMIANTLATAGFAVAPDAAQGQAASLARCAAYRDQGRRTGDRHQDHAAAEVHKANGELHQLKVAPRA